MENTLENKAKFFAQYLNQDVLYQNRIGKIVSFYLSCGNFEKQVWILSLEDENFEQNELSCSASVKDCQLLLKPLSSITNEDLKYFYTEMFTGEKMFFNSKEEVLEHYESFKFWTSKEADILRSLGFAIEWMGLSVEKLVDFGWVKLSKN